MADSATTLGKSPSVARSHRPRLTSRGAGLLAISVMVVFYGIFLHEPGCVHLGLLGLFVLGGSFLWAGQNLRELSFARTTPESAFAGQFFPLKLTVTNNRIRQDAFALDYEDSIAGTVEKGLRVDWLQAGGMARREMQSRLLKRGMVHPAHVNFESMFPLGLWKSRIDQKSNLEMTIFPRPIPPKMFEDPHFLTRLETDEAESSFIDWEGDFHGLREFQPGDRTKLIHWPTSARSHHLIVRQFNHRLPSQVTLVFHSIRPDSKPQPAEVFESALELLCGMLLLFRERGTPVEMIASFNQWQRMQVESKAQLRAALLTLAAAKRTAERNCNALHDALSGAEAGHRVIVLSDVPLKEWGARYVGASLPNNMPERW